MSEDIDIFVTFGPGVSNSARDRILKSLVERGEQDVGLQSTAKTSEKSVHRSRDFAYPQQHSHVALTGQRVLLELGTRGGPEPHQRLWVRSLLAEITCDDFGLPAAEFLEFAPVEVDTLAAERTLFEKLARCTIWRKPPFWTNASTRTWVLGYGTPTISTTVKKF